MSYSPKPSRPDAEAGFVLLAALFLCVLLLITLAVAAPTMARSIQRDKELETIHRGEQYRRAIQLYYRKFQRYPTSIDQLVETNQMRFLRKRYTDPMTGKDDWKPVLFGQAHVRPLGFFGQPLMAAAGMAGMGGMSASMYAPVAATTDANGVPVAPTDGSSGTSAGTTTSGSPGGGMFGSSPTTPGSGFGGAQSSPLGSSSPGSMFGNSPSSPMGGSAIGGSTTSPIGGTSGGMFGSASGSGGASASTLGGVGPIVGFTLPVKKPSLIDYMKQTSYDHWEFNYDPMAEAAQAMAGMTGGAGGTPNGPNGTMTGPGMPNTNGPGPNSGSSLIPPDTPTTTEPQTEPQ